MLFDPLTMLFQIVNFVVLVVALKYLLYDRVIAAMREREDRIAGRFRHAEEREADAEQRAAEYEQRCHELESERDAYLAEARREAEQRRDELVATAREEVGEQRARWEQALGDEQADLRRHLEQRAARAVCSISRAVLDDLAGADLTARAADRAIDQLERDPAPLETLLRAGGAVVVRTAAELDDEHRDRIRALVRRHAVNDEPTVAFRLDEGLGVGLRIEADGRFLPWTARDRIDELVDEIERLVDDAGGREAR